MHNYTQANMYVNDHKNQNKSHVLYILFLCLAFGFFLQYLQNLCQTKNVFLTPCDRKVSDYSKLP